MSEADIRRYTSAELREMRERGESRTDWARVRAMTDADVEAAIADDPDEPVWDDDLQAQVVVVRPGQSLFVQLDADVVEFFRSHGPGWERQINDILRAHQKANFKP